METTVLRQKLHQFMDTIKDKQAKAIYTLFENEIDIDSQRKKLIETERLKYLAGDIESFSWNQVKEMAIDKQKWYSV